MTPAQLSAALRAQAHGLHCLEAAADLLIDHGHFLARKGFAERFIHLSSSTDGVTTTAVIDWPATIAALDNSDLPCSGGERRVLRLAASIADGIPVDLRDALTGLDQRTTNLVVTAIFHATGNRGDHPPQIHDHH